jgi:hypothetical protein
VGETLMEPRGMRPIIDWIEQLRVFWLERIRRLEELLESMDE